MIINFGWTSEYLLKEILILPGGCRPRARKNRRPTRSTSRSIRRQRRRSASRRLPRPSPSNGNEKSQSNRKNLKMETNRVYWGRLSFIEINSHNSFMKITKTWVNITENIGFNRRNINFLVTNIFSKEILKNWNRFTSWK